MVFFLQPFTPCAGNSTIIGAKIGQNAELRIGIQEVRLHELLALMILEILSITDPVEDYRERQSSGIIGGK
jgi:hypothetical protein